MQFIILYGSKLFNIQLLPLPRGRRVQYCVCVCYMSLFSVLNATAVKALMLLGATASQLMHILPVATVQIYNLQYQIK